MNYDTFTASAFTFTAKTRYYAPRIAGLWVYTVAMLGLLIVWFGYQAYESGQLFRAQFNEGYRKGLLMPAIEDVDLPTIGAEYDFNAMTTNDDVILEESIYPDVREQVAALKWQELRKLGKALGHTHKNKTALLTALTEETDLDDLYEAWADLTQA